MSKIKGATPLKTWLIWTVTVLGAFLVITWQYFKEGMMADETKVSWLIIAFFIYGFIASLLAALCLQKEHTSLLKSMAAQDVISDKTLISDIFGKIKRQVTTGKPVNLRSLLSAYTAKINCQIQNVSVTSGMLITVGLLGTVIGLIRAIGGLDTVLKSVGANQADFLSGLNATLSGMSTAFYTTFFGALLGGVVLKVLAAELKKSAVQLSADAIEFGELYIMPLASADANETLDAIQERIKLLKDHLNSFQNSFAETSHAMTQFNSNLAQNLKSITETVQSVSGTVETGNAKLKGSFTEAGDAIVTGAKHMALETGGAFKEFSDTLGQNLSGINEAIVSVSDTVNAGNTDLKAGFAGAGETIISGAKHMALETGGAFKEFSNTLGQNLSGINEAIVGVSDTVNAGNENLKTGFAGAGETIIAGAKHMATETGGAFQEFSSALGQNLSGINEAIVGVSDTVNAGNENLKAGFIGAGETIIAGAQKMAMETGGAFQQFSTDLGQNLNGINESVKAVSAAITDSNAGLKESLSLAGETVTAGVKQITAETDTAFKQFNSELGHNLNGINETIIAGANSINDGTQELLDGFSAAKSSIVASANDITNSVSAQNKKLVSSLSGLTDTVEKTNSDVHNMAAKRLNTQEADLAKKLSAAAAMFQSLANPTAATENTTGE
jgi:hypothetical protein